MNIDEYYSKEKLEKKYETLRQWISIRVKISSTFAGFSLTGLSFVFTISLFNSNNIIASTFTFFVISFIWFSILLAVFFIADRKILEIQLELIEKYKDKVLTTRNEKFNEIRDGLFVIDRLNYIGFFSLIIFMFFLSEFVLKLFSLYLMIVFFSIIIFMTWGVEIYSKIRSKILKKYKKEENLPEAKKIAFMTLVISLIAFPILFLLFFIFRFFSPKFFYITVFLTFCITLLSYNHHKSIKKKIQRGK